MCCVLVGVVFGGVGGVGSYGGWVHGRVESWGGVCGDPRGAEAKGRTGRGEHGSMGGGVGQSEKPDTLAAWRLCGLSALCSVALGSGEGEGMMALVGGRGSVAPLGLDFDGGTEPSAHALGYRLTALRAWGNGLGGAEGAEA